MIRWHVDLVESSDEEYQNVRDKLYNCYIALTNVAYITDMAASKMLYLKRPRLVAISDSYVREGLEIRDPNTKIHPWKSEFCAARALAVSDKIRETGKHNINCLENLQKMLSPVEISKARIVDILIWTSVAIKNGHTNWSRWAKESEWSILEKE
jgi:hypothetical protein